MRPETFSARLTDLQERIAEHIVTRLGFEADYFAQMPFFELGFQTFFGFFCEFSG